MTETAASVEAILRAQFALTAKLSQHTSVYHRLLQKQGAAAFARQMAEDGPAEALALAEADEALARQACEACDDELKVMEAELLQLGHALAALPKEGR